MIYLDHNATTPVDGRVLDAMLPYLKTYYGNPSSLYRQGRVVKSAIDTAREHVANLAGASPAQVIFTSGGTEANNLALTAIDADSGLAISAIEHPSVTEPALRLKNRGHDLSIVAVDTDGLIGQAAIEQVIDKKPALVSLMMANNETGAIQDIAGHASRLKANPTLVHTDAVQALGKIPLDFNRLDVDMMSLSSHKLYGPKGCGALLLKKGVNIQPLLVGGGQEQGFRAGTENAAAIVGFGKAAELALAEFAERNEKLLSLRKILETGLAAIPELTIFARHADRLPNTVQFGIPGIDGEMLQMRLDQKAVAVSSGSACASGGKEPSPVLTAMGVDADLARSAIRVSLGLANTEADIHHFIQLLKSLVCRE